MLKFYERHTESLAYGHPLAFGTMRVLHQMNKSGRHLSVSPGSEDKGIVTDARAKQFVVRLTFDDSHWDVCSCGGYQALLWP